VNRRALLLLHRLEPHDRARRATLQLGSALLQQPKVALEHDVPVVLAEVEAVPDLAEGGDASLSPLATLLMNTAPFAVSKYTCRTRR